MKPSRLLLIPTLLGALGFATPAIAHDTHHTIRIGDHNERKIEDLTDAELKEVRMELRDALVEIKDAREDIKDDLEDEDVIFIARGALRIAEGSLDTAEDEIRNVLKRVEAEQAKRAKTGN